MAGLLNQEEHMSRIDGKREGEYYHLVKNQLELGI